MTVAHDHDDLHHLAGRLTPHQAARLRLLVAADPVLAPEIIRERLKRSA